MKKIALLAAISFVSCGKIVSPAKQPQASSMQLLQTRYEANLSKLDDWPSRTDCDGTLFASLALSGGVNLDITEARNEEGQWFRSPAHDCFDHGRSRSDFSNDMLVGLVLALGDADLRQYHAWLKEHDYRTGRGDPITAVVKPNVLGVLSRRTKLDKMPRFPYMHNSKDYVRHIQMLMIYIDGRTTGHLKAAELGLLLEYQDNVDYLLSAIIARYNGNYERAAKMLLAEGKPPTYVRGDQPERYRLAHWLLAAKITLGDK